MRVLVIHDDAAQAGGANQFRRGFSQLLERAGHEVFLFTYRRGDGDDPRRSHEFQPNDRFSTSVLLGCMGSVPVVQTVHDHRIICPTGRGIAPDGTECVRGPTWRCYRQGCLSLRDCAVEAVPRTLKRFLLKRVVDCFLVPSMDLQDKMRTHGFQAALLRHYVDASWVQPVPLDPTGNRILFVGRLNEGKGVDVLLHALEHVRRQLPGATLDLVGEDETEGRLKALACALRLREQVRFHGQVSHERVVDFYAKAHVVVLPAAWIENSPLVILEAMASARPVVAGRVGGIPEIVVDGETGLLCAPGDARDLAEKIVQVLANRDRAAVMGRLGRTRVEELYSVRRHLDEFFQIMEGIVGSPLLRAHGMRQ